MCAAETWIIKKTEADRINAFEMLAYRRMLRMPWIAHRTDTFILVRSTQTM